MDKRTNITDAFPTDIMDTLDTEEVDNILVPELSFDREEVIQAQATDDDINLIWGYLTSDITPDMAD